MTVLFDGELAVSYWQFYVESRAEDYLDGLGGALGGQVNGLCGAAVPGLLSLTTGLHSGAVELVVEVLDAAVPVAAGWEDVVEVAFRPETETVYLVECMGDTHPPLTLEPADYRVRYCASGMDEAHAQDTLPDGEPPLDRYLLQLWPAPTAPDTIVRRTSRCAAYWHAHARNLPPPPTPAQRAEARRQERLAGERANRQAARDAEARRWGGRPPSARLKHLNGGLTLARLDRALVDAIESLDATTQRAIGAWAARQACAEAGLSELDWVAAALTAIEQGDPLPAPFDDPTAAFQRLRTDPHAPRTTVPAHDGRHARVSQQHMALPALWSATARDPLTAGLEPLFHAIVTFGDRYPRLLADVRHAFPALPAA